jgi:hypothetical protein
MSNDEICYMERNSYSILYEMFVMRHPLQFLYLESIFARSTSKCAVVVIEGQLNALQTLDLDKNRSLLFSATLDSRDPTRYTSTHVT